MPGRRLTLIVLLMATVSLAACARGPSGPAEDPAQPEPTPSAGVSLPVGLHEISEGSAVAVGELRRVDLEGGFWAIVRPGEDPASGGDVIAVIANGDDLARELDRLEGVMVQATGKRLEGASVRMAGPELSVETIEALKTEELPAQ